MNSVGYNPKKPGRQVFTPCFALLGETRDFLHGMFRTGKAHTSRGVKGFIYECLKMTQDRIGEIYLRADSGFYDPDFLDYLEKKGSPYADDVVLRSLLD